MAEPVTWAEFEQAAPEIAAVGRALLYRADSGEVGLLATVDANDRPRMAPVCPIFTGTGVFLLVGARTPKCRHLFENGRYALHASVGTEDEEFQIRGHALPVEADPNRSAVIEAIPFPSFDPKDPVFELRIEWGLAVTWPTPGHPLKRSWSVPGSSG